MGISLFLGGSKRLPRWFGALTVFGSIQPCRMVKNGPKKSAPECPVECGGGVQLLFGQCPNGGGVNPLGSSLRATVMIIMMIIRTTATIIMMIMMRTTMIIMMILLDNVRKPLQEQHPSSCYSDQVLICTLWYHDTILIIDGDTWQTDWQRWKKCLTTLDTNILRFFLLLGNEKCQPMPRRSGRLKHFFQSASLL